ncbi:Maternal protein pumilio [Hondaea fermentalgiana]|uniref:Maternal protein pumilio n=1 Tax=Hondaea fermentalgiana TaxID=2315210 RepID=A0A2R5GH92_9STRA|nr:Maternal protein pumilio [Hondaea fermentalgiana]|eukprot:GBG29709.1 Maternal protein pumilio [Hondaea fermentalgiana]
MAQNYLQHHDQVHTQGQVGAERENCGHSANQNAHAPALDVDISKLKRCKSLTWDACTWNNNMFDNVSSVCNDIPQELASSTLLDFLTTTGQTPRLPKKSASFFQDDDVAEAIVAAARNTETALDAPLGTSGMHHSHSPSEANKKRLFRRATFANFPNSLSGNTLRGGPDHLRLRREAGAYEHPPEWTTLPAMREVADNYDENDDDDEEVDEFRDCGEDTESLGGGAFRGKRRNGRASGPCSPERASGSGEDPQEMSLRRVNSATLVRRAFPEMLFDRRTPEPGETEESKDDGAVQSLCGPTLEVDTSSEVEMLTSAAQFRRGRAMSNASEIGSIDSASPMLSPSSPVPPGFSSDLGSTPSSPLPPPMSMSHHPDTSSSMGRNSAGITYTGQGPGATSAPQACGTESPQQGAWDAFGVPMMSDQQQAMQQAMQQHFAMYMQQMMLLQQQAALAANANMGMNMGGMNSAGPLAGAANAGAAPGMHMGQPPMGFPMMPPAYGMPLSMPMGMPMPPFPFPASASYQQQQFSQPPQSGRSRRESGDSLGRKSGSRSRGNSTGCAPTSANSNSSSTSSSSSSSTSASDTGASRENRRGFAAKGSREVGLTPASAVLSAFRQKSSRPSVRELQSHVVEFAQDSLGSRYLQQLMPRSSAQDQKALMDELMLDALEIAQDLFGNYVIQVFLKHAEQSQRDTVARLMRGSILELSKHPHGCRVVQRVLELSSPEDRLVLMEEIMLDSDILRDAALDSHASHVLQKALLVLQHDLSPDLTLRPGRGPKPATLARGTGMHRSSPQRGTGSHAQSASGGALSASGSSATGNSTSSSASSNNHGQILTSLIRSESSELRARCQVLIDTVEKLVESEVESMTVDPNACRLVQRALADCDRERSSCVRSIVDAVEKDYERLALDQHGNFILQHILQFGQQAQADRIQSFVSSRCVDLAQHKFGSHLVEQCLLTGTASQANEIVREILDAPDWVLLNLMKDPYANFVLQRAFEISGKSDRVRIAAAIDAQSEVLMQYAHGRHILSFLAKRRIA